MKTEWTLTHEAFENLLLWLSPDREEAAQKYEDIRRRLIRLFNSRGCYEPEELADETINRVVMIVETRASEYSVEPIRLFFGVAQKVLQEWRHRKVISHKDLLPWPSMWDERDLECLDECMDHLPERGRSIIIRYYEEEGREKIRHRQMIADELGIEINALRIEACRIRKRLRHCVSACRRRKAA
jgi:DNA-directed RNA polymerase specialized sigma24 family protein